MHSNLNTMIIIDDALVPARLGILYSRHDFQTISVILRTVSSRLNVHRNFNYIYNTQRAKSPPIYVKYRRKTDVESIT